MRDSGDSYDDMERFALDQDTADRLLSGALAPEDAPHRYGEVASLIRMAAGPTAGALDGEAAAVAEVVEAIRSGLALTPARQRLPWHRTRLKTAAAALVGAVTVTGSLAAADALPAPAQRVAAHAFSVVGVDIPNPSHGPETRARQPGRAPGGTAATTASTSTSAARLPTATTLTTTATDGLHRPAASSTATVTAPTQPGAGAGAGRPLTSAPTPPPGAPQSAPAPAHTGGPGAGVPAASSSPAPQKQALRPSAAPERGSEDNSSGNRASPQRGSPNGQGAAHRATPTRGR